MFLSDMYREMGNDAEAERYISLGKEASKFKKVGKRGKRRAQQRISQDD